MLNMTRRSGSGYCQWLPTGDIDTTIVKTLLGMLKNMAMSMNQHHIISCKKWNINFFLVCRTGCLASSETRNYAPQWTLFRGQFLTAIIPCNPHCHLQPGMQHAEPDFIPCQTFNMMILAHPRLLSCANCWLAPTMAIDFNNTQALVVGGFVYNVTPTTYKDILVLKGWWIEKIYCPKKSLQSVGRVWGLSIWWFNIYFSDSDIRMYPATYSNPWSQ